jgi:anti-sigma regulatory factor (Ser/Thr protein kinase)
VRDVVGSLRGFGHEILLYRGLEDLVARTAAYLAEGLSGDEPVLVALLPERNQAVAAALERLGEDPDRVRFVDMRALGANPARIIPAWQAYVDEAISGAVGCGGAPARVLAEPLWVGRRPVEVEECLVHEGLLDLAFGDGAPWQLLCAYDAAELPAPHLEAAVRSHRRPDAAAAALVAGLRPPAGPVVERAFDLEGLLSVREHVGQRASAVGVDRDAAQDLVLAAHELASNSVQHGGGRGRLRSWSEPGAFVVEVSDTGRIHDPLVGRQITDVSSEHGRGVWMANQLCDLVQLRSSAAGTVVRLFAWLS